jgi:hypothetical protein
MKLLVFSLIIISKITTGVTYEPVDFAEVMQNVETRKSEITFDIW